MHTSYADDVGDAYMVYFFHDRLYGDDTMIMGDIGDFTVKK
jgi:hypothetical protein